WTPTPVPCPGRARRRHPGPPSVELACADTNRVIRPCAETDRGQSWPSSTRLRKAYRDVIPADRWHKPYMPARDLDRPSRSCAVFVYGGEPTRTRRLAPSKPRLAPDSVDQSPVHLLKEP